MGTKPENAAITRIGLEQGRGQARRTDTEAKVDPDRAEYGLAEEYERHFCTREVARREDKRGVVPRDAQAVNPQRDPESWCKAVEHRPYA